MQQGLQTEEEKKPGKRAFGVKWRYNVIASILDLVLLRTCAVRSEQRFWQRLSRVSQSLWVMRSHEIRRIVGENCQKFSSLQKALHFIVVLVTRLSVKLSHLKVLPRFKLRFPDSGTVCVFILSTYNVCVMNIIFQVEKREAPADCCIVCRSWCTCCYA